MTRLQKARSFLCLYRLPGEIKHMIIANLSFADLRTACLVDRRLKAIAQPLLYSRIKWTLTSTFYNPPMPQLLRTLMRRTGLAASISSQQVADYFPLVAHI